MPRGGHEAHLLRGHDQGSTQRKQQYVQQHTVSEQAPSIFEALKARAERSSVDSAKHSHGDVGEAKALVRRRGTDTLAEHDRLYGAARDRGAAKAASAKRHSDF